jgi:hypothetical protein
MITRPSIPLIAVAAASALGLIVSVWFMAQRVDEFHDANPRQTFAFEPINVREFNFAGRAVSVQDEHAGDAAAPLGHVIVRYGDEQLRLRVAIPGRSELPGLMPYADWFRVMRFGLLTGRTMEQFRTDLGVDVEERLVVVTRTPRPGTDPQTWGAVWKKDWTFEFHEFLPDGSFASERLKYPSYRVGQTPKAGELRENTWQYHAALQLLPQAGRNGPMYRFTEDAVKRMGWTLPVAAATGLTLFIVLGFALAPRRSITPAATA